MSKTHKEMKEDLILMDVETGETTILKPKQVGGSHYKLPIEPVEYIMQNKLDYLQGNVVKYITRFRDKNGKEDLQKAIHYIEMIIEREYND
jgi:hypothetical protein